LKYYKRVIACLLTIEMLVSILPGAMATDKDSVLKSISLCDTAKALKTPTVETGDNRQITLYVPYSYSDSTTFDLNNDLVYSVDLTKYKSVVVTPESDSIPITSESDTTHYVKLTVTFNLISESDSDARSETDYDIRVVKASKITSVFTGVISEKLSLDTASLSLSSAISGNYIQSEGNALSQIKISGSNADVGTLTFPEGLTFGSKISVSSFDKLKFVPSACGTVSYGITAYDTDNVVVGTAVLTIIVYAIPEIKNDITDTIYVGSERTFTAKDFTDNCDMHNKALAEIQITPDVTTAGKWYVGSEPTTGAITIGASSIGTLSFKATAAGTATFTWNIKNSAGYADKPRSGTLTVLSAELTLSAYSSSTGIIKGSTFTTGTSYFGYSPSKATLTYLKIVTIPAATDGDICLTSALAKNDALGYPAITANSPLKAGTIIPNAYIKYLSLVTKSASTSSNISFTWSATCDSSAKNAVWASAVSFTVAFKTAGILSYSTQKGVPVTLNASDFSTQYSNASGYNLSYVTFTLPATTAAKFWYNYNLSTKTGTAVTATAKYYVGANPNISNLTLVPNADYSGTITIAFNAYKSDGTFLTGTVNIIVNENMGGTVSYTIDKNDWIRIDAVDFTKVFQNSTGTALSYVRFGIPSTTYGNLYYNYVSASNYDSTVSSSTNYYVYSASYLSYVAFASTNNYTGTVVISYTGYNAQGTGYSGKLIVFIVDSPAGIVSCTCKENGSIPIPGATIASEFISITGSLMSYMAITPPAATIGTLYYNYSTDTKTGTKVTASTKYLNGSSPDISNITFVAAKDYTGKVEIKYTGYSPTGTAYIGKLKITVGATSAGTLALSTKLNTSIKFNSNSFSNNFHTDSGGSTLSYVTFTLPLSAYGVLYYNSSSASYGTAISAETKYYVAAEPFLSSIMFVPQTGYIGLLTIAFTGYTSDGIPYKGKIQIMVGGGDGSVYYSTSSDAALTFSSSDFASAYYAAMGIPLSYVVFTLPSYTYGTLFYGYSSSSGTSTYLSSYTNYYQNTYPYINNISFVPNSSYTGTFSLIYTGYGTNGSSYSNSVIITVTALDGGTVTYKTNNDTPINFDSADFSSTFQSKTGSSLYSVKFTLPSSSYGRLVYQYNSPNNYNYYVSSDNRYYKSIYPLLSDVTFIPSSSYIGKVPISYTAFNALGTAYVGNLSITVNDANAYPFSDVDDNYSWASSAILYLYKNDIILGSGDGKYEPGSKLTRGDFILIISRAFGLTATTSENFSDVPSGSYYYDAIAAAKELGITQGSDGNFYPDKTISRQDAMVIISRALEIAGKPLEDGSSSDLSNYSDQNDISSYATAAAASLVKAGILKGSDGYLNPKKMISRAEMAVILYNVLMN